MEIVNSVAFLNCFEDFKIISGDLSAEYWKGRDSVCALQYCNLHSEAAEDEKMS